jgi:hypothetical protein
LQGGKVAFLIISNGKSMTYNSFSLNDNSSHYGSFSSGYFFFISISIALVDLNLVASNLSLA